MPAWPTGDALGADSGRWGGRAGYALLRSPRAVLETGTRHNGLADHERSREMTSSPHSPSDDLRKLHETYIEKVNVAVSNGQLDLAAELADEYVEDATREILGAE